MQQNHNVSLVTLQKEIDRIADQLCLVVKGEFDFTIDPTKTADESAQKLTMLVNFVLDAARRAILEIREKNDKLTELDKLKSEFMANISHELRTPLTLILGPVETILQNSTNHFTPEIKLNLQRVHRNAMRLYILVNDLLDFSKLEAGKFVINEEGLNIIEVISQLVDDAKGLALERQITLKFIYAEQIINIWLDRKIIEKIALNLISNALKFTPKSGTITVELKRQNNMLCLSVTDTGIGISKAQLPNIFERFHQVDSSSTRDNPGTGIGLALVSQFVNLIHGKIDVESTEGKGSRFEVFIPEKPFGNNGHTIDANNAHVPTKTAHRNFFQTIAESIKEEVEPSEEFEIDDSKPLILIADDNADLRTYIQSFLKKNFSIMTASNGKQALKIAQKHLPMVILSDVMMPKMDGYQLTKALKKDPLMQNIPIILITAKMGTEALVDSLNVGADDFLAKPFSSEELIARVNSAHRRHQEYLKNRDLNNQLVNFAHRAGMADIATSTLHNVGNILNSINVSVKMIEQNIDKPHIKNLSKVMTMIQENVNNLSNYFTEDPKGKILPEYLSALTEEIHSEHIHINEEVQRLRQQIKYIEEIVAMQQTISGKTGFLEKIFLPDLINTAISMYKSSIEKNKIHIVKNIKENVFLLTDKNKLLQIILNLIQNAKDALSTPSYPSAENKLITIKVTLSQIKDHINIIVNDNGVGIDPKNLNKIFSFGFTTKVNGHGFGLHNSALAAKELGGMLQANSKGIGLGAEFILTLPLESQRKKDNE